MSVARLLHRAAALGIVALAFLLTTFRRIRLFRFLRLVFRLAGFQA